MKEDSRIQTKTLATLRPILLALVMSASSGSTAFDTFQPASVLVSDPDTKVTDFEPEPIGNRFAWVDSSLDLWIGELDADTGEFVPPDGRGIFLDFNAASAGELLTGPEWALTARGPQVVYTKKLRDRYILAKASAQAGGWLSETLFNGVDKFAPYGSLDQGDRYARIFYGARRDPSNPRSPKVFSWRYLNHPWTEVEIGTDLSPSRWVPGAEQLLYTARSDTPAGAASQAFILDLESGEATKITDGNGFRQNPLVWTAPDFDNRRLMAVGRDKNVLEVYIEPENPALEGTEWALLHELTPPEEAVGQTVFYARPFVHQDLSNIVMIAMECRDNCNGKYRRRSPGEVWLIGSLSGEPTWRRISADVPAIRVDPETVWLQGQPYIYIYRYLAADGSPGGVYKLETGL